MIPFDSILVLLSAVLGLSLVVERILEFVQNWLERIRRSGESRKIPNLSAADQMMDKLKETHEKYGKDEEWEERFSNTTILVEPATDPDDGSTLKAFILQLLGFATGIILVRASGLQLFNSLLGESKNIAPWADYLFTGLLIGGGSAPIHLLIRFISERKITVQAETIPAEEKKPSAQLPLAKPAAPGIIPAISPMGLDEWVDIPYDGGVDLEMLEGVHKRQNNPDLIIYHHTAMNSQSTFEDVVRVIKARDWLTGYNCVVLADGSVHPFCRWDRFGNHAKGHNMRSLGIAFNGNYETDPGVPDSNPDGRLGPPRPTEAQLKAGARVVTLWTFLYKIAVDFSNFIIPHKQISAKACPGSAFPYDEFQKWIKFYRNRWEQSAAVGERITAYKLKPYLYV